LGLSDRDEVHRVTLTGGEREVLSPEEVSIPEGAWVEFVSADWRVHDIRFDLDSLPEAARAFLEESDQVASPPLVDRGARFVVSFEGAPDGRYPFVAEGNGAPGRGVVVVGPSR
jgi:plastocyanin